MGLIGRAGERVHYRIRHIVFKARVSQSYREIQMCEETILQCSTELYNLVPQDIHSDFLELLTVAHDTVLQKIRLSCDNKFEELLGRQLNSRTCNSNQMWIKNLTSVSIPDNVQSVLALGDKFAPKQHLKKNDVIDVVARITAATSDLPLSSRHEIRSKAVNILTNHAKAPSRDTLDDIQLRQDIKIAREFISSHPEIIVSRADKGNVTVVADKQDYVTR